MKLTDKYEDTISIEENGPGEVYVEVDTAGSVLGGGAVVITPQQARRAARALLKHADKAEAQG